MKSVRRIASTAAIAALFYCGSEQGALAEDLGVQDGALSFSNSSAPTQHIRGRSEKAHNRGLDEATTTAADDVPASTTPMSDALEQLMGPLQKTFKEVEGKVEELQKSFQATATKLGSDLKKKEKKAIAEAKVAKEEKKASRKAKKEARRRLRAKSVREDEEVEDAALKLPAVLTIKPINLADILSSVDTAVSDVAKQSRGAIDNSTDIMSGAFQDLYGQLDNMSEQAKKAAKDTQITALQTSMNAFNVTVAKQVETLMKGFNGLIKSVIDDVEVYASPDSSGLTELFNKAGLPNLQNMLDDLAVQKEAEAEEVEEKKEDAEKKLERRLAARQKNKKLNSTTEAPAPVDGDGVSLQVNNDLALQADNDVAVEGLEVVKFAFGSFAKFIEDMTNVLLGLQENIKILLSPSQLLGTPTPLVDETAAETTAAPSKTKTTTSTSTITTTIAPTTTTTAIPSTATLRIVQSTTTHAALSDSTEAGGRRLADENPTPVDPVKKLTKEIQATLNNCSESLTKLVNTITESVNINTAVQRKLALPALNTLGLDALDVEIPTINPDLLTLRSNLTALLPEGKLNLGNLDFLGLDSLLPNTTLGNPRTFVHNATFPTLPPLLTLPTLPTTLPTLDTAIESIPTLAPFPTLLPPSDDDESTSKILSENTKEMLEKIRIAMNNLIKQMNDRTKTFSNSVLALPKWTVEDFNSVTGSTAQPTLTTAKPTTTVPTEATTTAPTNEATTIQATSTTEAPKATAAKARALQANNPLARIGDSILSMANGVAKATGSNRTRGSATGNAFQDGVLSLADSFDSSIDKNPKLLSALADPLGSLDFLNLDTLKDGLNLEGLNLGALNLFGANITDPESLINSLNNASLGDAGNLLNKGVDTMTNVLSTSANKISSTIPDSQMSKALKEATDSFLESIDEVKDELTKSGTNATKSMKETFDELEAQVKSSADKIKTGKPISETTIGDLKKNVDEGSDLVSLAAKNATKSLGANLDSLKKQIAILNASLDKFSGKKAAEEDEEEADEETNEEAVTDSKPSTTDFVNQFFKKPSATAAPKEKQEAQDEEEAAADAETSEEAVTTTENKKDSKLSTTDFVNQFFKKPSATASPEEAEDEEEAVPEDEEEAVPEDEEEAVPEDEEEASPEDEEEASPEDEEEASPEDEEEASPEDEEEASPEDEEEASPEDEEEASPEEEGEAEEETTEAPTKIKIASKNIRKMQKLKLPKLPELPGIIPTIAVPSIGIPTGFIPTLEPLNLDAGLNLETMQEQTQSAFRSAEDLLQQMISYFTNTAKSFTPGYKLE